MSEGPSNVIQFRQENGMSEAEHKRMREYYFGGCGPKSTYWPKRHKWGAWKTYKIKETGQLFRERMCLTCSLVSDRKYIKETPNND